MARVNILLAAVLMLSALSLVTARFQWRQLFVQLNQLQNQARELDNDWRRLQLERAELMRNARIDGMARHELEMTAATPGRTIYLPARKQQETGGASQ